MKFKRLEEQLKLDEGFRAEPYQDIFGYWTIGYGSRYILGKPVDSHAESLTEAGATDLLRAHIYLSLIECQKLFTNFNDLPDRIQEVLVNMSYNLGGKLYMFQKMREAVGQRNWPWMAAEMKNSNWYLQVGTRAQRLVAMVEGTQDV